ncbi:hypothetical protein NDU88_011724 [Pleurodeles waltl]|uniref:Uncharacterized protein n=1 Tax=Pleurodeles waltl TaxID=8319 RepID=A0AAV7S3H8_PLEWA|nr:hypothetical protein NDU88_011724 [Pleurodeles waltl]
MEHGGPYGGAVYTPPVPAVARPRQLAQTVLRREALAPSSRRVRGALPVPGMEHGGPYGGTVYTPPVPAVARPRELAKTVLRQGWRSIWGYSVHPSGQSSGASQAARSDRPQAGGPGSKLSQGQMGPSCSRDGGPYGGTVYTPPVPAVARPRQLAQTVLRQEALPPSSGRVRWALPVPGMEVHMGVQCTPLRSQPWRVPGSSLRPSSGRRPCLRALAGSDGPFLFQG